MVMGRWAGSMVLPVPFHCQFHSLVCTCIVHIILESAEEGCTIALYIHGWSHTWFNPRNRMLFSNEARERDLRVAKRYAHVLERNKMLVFQNF